MTIMTCLTSPRETELAALASASNGTAYLDIVTGEHRRILRGASKDYDELGEEVTIFKSTVFPWIVFYLYTNEGNVRPHTWFLGCRAVEVTEDIFANYYNFRNETLESFEKDRYEYA
jgi:hypothetical protein